MARRAALLLIVMFLLGTAVAGCTRAAPVSFRPGGGPGPVDVNFKAADGVRLGGRLFGNGSVAVILAHMYPTDQRSWEGFARQLAAEGFTALTFDFRGYYRSAGTRDASLIDRDIAAAIAFIRAQEHEKVFLIGAGMGGTAALKRAASDGVDGVVTLSAPVQFMGLSAAAEIRRIAAPKLFMAAGGDGAAAARRMYREAAEPKELQILPGPEHGSGMLSGSAGHTAVKHIVEFLIRNSR